LQRTDSLELSEWMAYYELEPFGYYADFQKHAMVASVIAEVNRNPKKKPTPYEAKDFMPKETAVEEKSVFQKLKDHIKRLSNVNGSETPSKA